MITAKQAGVVVVGLMFILGVPLMMYVGWATAPASGVAPIVGMLTFTLLGTFLIIVPSSILVVGVLFLYTLMMDDSCSEDPKEAME